MVEMKQPLRVGTSTSALLWGTTQRLGSHSSFLALFWPRCGPQLEGPWADDAAQGGMLATAPNRPGLSGLLMLAQVDQLALWCHHCHSNQDVSVTAQIGGLWSGRNAEQTAFIPAQDNLAFSHF